MSDPADFNAKLLVQGHEEVLKPYVDSGDITIVAEQWCKGWDPNEALKHMENALQQIKMTFKLSLHQ